MTDELLWAVATGTNALAFWAGVALGRRTGKVSARPVPSGPICGCKHELAKHDPQTNVCHEAIPADRYEASGAYRLTGRCKCRQYTGPRPIDEVFQPRIVLPQEDT